MFDLDVTGESYWMGPKPKKKRRREEPLFGDMGASAYEDYYAPKPRYRQRSPSQVYRKTGRQKIVYVERRKPRRRTTYRPRQKSYSTSDYIRGTIKGAKAAYGGSKVTYRGAKKTYKSVSKFVSKVGKPKTMQSRSWKDKLFRKGSIYKKE